MRISLLAVVVVSTLFGCQSSAPPKPHPISEEPFKLAVPAPTADPPPEGDDGTGEAPAAAGTDVPEPPDAGAFTGGPAHDCPRGKSVPGDLDVASGTLAVTPDGGAAPSEIRFAATNRSSAPRAIQITELDLLASAANGRGWQKATPTPIRRVYLEEGGGGLSDNKVNVLPKATVRVVVEFDPEGASGPGRRGVRAHFTVDEKHACFEVASGSSPRTGGAAPHR